jgi:hypothetical protein
MTPPKDSCLAPRPPARPPTLPQSPVLAAALQICHPHAAGIDIGEAEHRVAVPPGCDPHPVRRCGTCTVDLDALADWLIDSGITTVAMASTSVSGPRFAPGSRRHAGPPIDPRHAVLPADPQPLSAMASNPAFHPSGLFAGALRPEAVCVLRGSVRHQMQFPLPLTICGTYQAAPTWRPSGHRETWGSGDVQLTMWRVKPLEVAGALSPAHNLGREGAVAARAPRRASCHRRPAPGRLQSAPLAACLGRLRAADAGTAWHPQGHHRHRAHVGPRGLSPAHTRQRLCPTGSRRLRSAGPRTSGHDDGEAGQGVGGDPRAPRSAGIRPRPRASTVVPVLPSRLPCPAMPPVVRVQGQVCAPHPTTANSIRQPGLSNGGNPFQDAPHPFSGPPYPPPEGPKPHGVVRQGLPLQIMCRRRRVEGGWCIVDGSRTDIGL